MRTQAEYIIERFGGLTATAKAIRSDLAVSVVQGWKERGTIPASRQRELLEAGVFLSPPLTAYEFIEDLDGTLHPHLRAAETVSEPSEAA